MPETDSSEPDDQLSINLKTAGLKPAVFEFLKLLLACSFNDFKEIGNFK